MISDAYMNIICDVCGEEEPIDLPFVYRNMSPSSGYYDHRDEAVLKRAKADGWTEKDGKHYCESCCDDKG